jgi:hypothetical protein
MAALRLLVGGVGAFVCLAASSLPVMAATKSASTPRPTPAGQARKLPPILPPVVFQVNPAKVNPTIQPNIVILGQHLSVTTRVQVGGRPATTVESADSHTLLVKLPLDLAKGSYVIQVTNEAGSTTADDPLVVDDAGTGPSNLTTLAGAGCLLLLVLVMRLARTPGLA